MFFRAAQSHPQNIAIIHKGNSITYESLEKSVISTAAGLIIQGIGKGDRVLVFVPMSIDLYRIVLAIFHVGATAVFLDEWVSAERLDACCKEAKCKALIAPFRIRMLAWLSPELRKIPLRLGLKYKSSEDLLVVPTTYKDDTALITFTTGSTGIPKAAKRTHGFLRVQFDVLQEELSPNPYDVSMTTLPIVLLINLGVGCTSVIPDYNAKKGIGNKAGEFIQLIKELNVNILMSSPSFVKALAEQLIAKPEKSFSIQKIFTGGAPVFPIDAEIFLEAFTGAEINVIFGSTEAEPISSTTVQKLISANNEKGLYVGAPNNNIEIKIIQIIDEIINDQDWEKIQMPDGNIGEIIVSGPHVLKEYFNNKEAFLRNKIVVGEKIWHRTGDSGFMEAGKLYLTGRSKELININGQVIAPFVLENKLRSVAGIKMGTFIQFDDALTAIVEMESTTNQGVLTSKIKSLHPLISEVRFINKMPVDLRHRSKIDYDNLKKLISYS